MGYDKGQILTYEYPVRDVKNTNLSKVINDYHRIVVLHRRGTPYNTILVAPITKASALKQVGKIPSNYVELLKDDYPFVLEEDSYINLDMTMPVDDVELADLERYNKRIDAGLIEFDLYQMDYKITLTYELNRYLTTEFAIRLNSEFENVVTYIDENIKAQISSLISKIHDKEVAESVIGIIDNLILELKKTYIKNNVKKGEYIKLNS